MNNIEDGIIKFEKIVVYYFLDGKKKYYSDIWYDPENAHGKRPWCIGFVNYKSYPTSTALLNDLHSELDSDLLCGAIDGYALEIVK